MIRVRRSRSRSRIRSARGPRDARRRLPRPRPRARGVASFELVRSFRLAASSATRRPGAVGARVAMLDLLDQLAFYGSYHRDPVNKAIHAVCVLRHRVLLHLVSCCELRRARRRRAPRARTRGRAPGAERRRLVRGGPRARGHGALRAVLRSPSTPSRAAPGSSAGGPDLALRDRVPLGTVDRTRRALGAHVACWALLNPGARRVRRGGAGGNSSGVVPPSLAPLFVWMEIMFACRTVAGCSAATSSEGSRSASRRWTPSRRAATPASHRAKRESATNAIPHQRRAARSLLSPR